MQKSTITILAFVLTLGISIFSCAATDSPEGDSAKRPADALHDGFTLQPLKFEVQHPYDLKLEERYSYDKATNTHDLWVLDTDKPHMPPPNKTEPRTEIRIEDSDYKPGSGLHMMDCDMYITPGTFACISQVFGTGPMCIIIVDKDGTITDLRTHDVIAKDMNDKWFNWTIIHDPDAVGPGAIKVYIDGKLATDKIEATKQASFYFKVGVYSRKDSNRNEVKVRNLQYLIKPSSGSTTRINIENFRFKTWVSSVVAGRLNNGTFGAISCL